MLEHVNSAIQWLVLVCPSELLCFYKMRDCWYRCVCVFGVARKFLLRVSAEIGEFSRAAAAADCVSVHEYILAGRRTVLMSSVRWAWSTMWYTQRRSGMLSAIACASVYFLASRLGPQSFVRSQIRWGPRDDGIPPPSGTEQRRASLLGARSLPPAARQKLLSIEGLSSPVRAPKLCV